MSYPHSLTQTSNTLTAAMLPQTQQPTAKRKVSEDSNPLLNAAKRAKKDLIKGAASNKRKLLNAEEQPGGLFIVRAPPQPPHTSSAQSNGNADPPPRPPPPLPPSTAVAGPSRPSKKTRVELAQHKRDHNSNGIVEADANPDPQLDQDIRAMEDEADHLRRRSRSQNTNPAFKLPSQPNTNPSSSDRQNRTHHRDTSVPLPPQETPQIERNKLLRQAAIARITGALDDDENSSSQASTSSSSRISPGNGSGGHRRKSSISMRGKRISSSFEATGVISQPHNSVSDSIFYKHIDRDLPEASRVSQLLVWCTSRAASTASTNSKSKTKDAPPLSAAGVLVLKQVQEDMMRMLAEKKIDTSVISKDDEMGEQPKVTMKENEQNVKNRQRKIIYGEYIERAQAENEAWKEVDIFYKNYVKSGSDELEQKRAAFARFAETQGIRSPSARAQGKQRATDPENGEDVDTATDSGISAQVDDWETWKPRIHELPPKFLGASGVELAMEILNSPSRSGIPHEEKIAQSTAFGRDRAERELKLQQRLGEVEWKLDNLHASTSAAMAAVNAAETALDHRFALLSVSLAERSRPPISRAGGSGSTAETLNAYLPRTEPRTGPDPQELLRALARVDRERPPAMIGDAARRAVREVQRVEESGAAGVGERRLTGVTVPATPRKIPGTPKRGSTPGRERER